MGTKQAKLALENDSQFVREYQSLQNRQTGVGGKAGSSASVQRRSLIGSAMNRNNIFGGKTMLDILGLELYFNEKWNLCPYGLRTRDEMQNLTLRAYCEADVKAAVKINTEQTPISDEDLAAIINAAPHPTETEMTQTANDVPAIETKIFIFGTDASTMSDDQIVDRIFDIERQIETLQSVKNKPKKLVAKLNAMQDDIKALVEYVDGRA